MGLMEIYYMGGNRMMEYVDMWICICISLIQLIGSNNRRHQPPNPTPPLINPNPKHPPPKLTPLPSRQHITHSLHQNQHLLPQCHLGIFNQLHFLICLTGTCCKCATVLGELVRAEVGDF